jgi:hypothetical protein
MIKKISKFKIPSDIFKKGWRISFPKSEEMFFEISEKFDKGSYDFIESRKKSISCPKGIVGVEAIDDKKYFRVIYIPGTITEDQVLNFAKQFERRK